MFTASSTDEVLREVIRAILEAGGDVSPRGAATREVLACSFRLLKPRARRIHSAARRWSEALAIGELSWHMAGSDDLDFISYYLPRWETFSPDGDRVAESCYGKKIFAQDDYGRNQWGAVRELLAQDPASRRAVLYLGSITTSRDASHPDVACVTTIQFLLRDSLMHCVMTMRSLDVIWGLGYDLFLGTMLQERLACELGVGLGWFQLSAGSMHLYQRHYDVASRILHEELSPFAANEMPPMRDVDAIPTFLAVERALRMDESDAVARVASLPLYWRDLAGPLVRLRGERRGAEQPVGDNGSVRM